MVAIEHRQNSSVATTTTSTSNQLNIVILSSSSSATSTASISLARTTTTSSTESQQEALPPISLDLAAKQNQQQLQQLTLKAKSKEELSHNHIFAVKTKMSTPPDEQQQKADSSLAKTETTTATIVAAATNPTTKSAISERNIDIKVDKKSNPDNPTQLSKKVLKLDLSSKELDDYTLKSPKSPISARLPHQVSLTSSVDVEDRKTLREALYQGIFHRHRKTIFAMGSFLRMLRSRNSQYNTIRSSSEGEDIDEVR